MVSGAAPDDPPHAALHCTPPFPRRVARARPPRVTPQDAVQALSPGEIRELQLVFEYLFGALLDLDGVCNKVLMDDKGLVVLCVFGLPYHSHEDDALRAAEFAATFVRRIERVTGRVAVGLSRAKVYCGNIGGARRKEFTVLGRGVNVSARLMQAAARHNDIKSTVLVTKEVFQDLKDHPNFAFGEPLPQELKVLPVALRPRAPRSPPGRSPLPVPVAPAP